MNTNPYRSLLLVLLPLVGCPLPDDKGDTGDTADTGGDTDTDTHLETGDTDHSTVSETGCYMVDAGATECPAAPDVDITRVTPATCGAEVLSVDGPGTLDDSCAYIGGFAPAAWCIYPITVDPPAEECDYGRPLVIGGKARLAPLARASGWQAEGVGADVPGTAGISHPHPAARAETWARIGLAEHASIASFARFALELMAFGAPADLVAGAHTAALDEVRHAKLAFGLASAHAADALGSSAHSRAESAPEAPTAHALGPGPLPLAGLTLATDLAAFAEATAREGCVAETLSALQMAEALARATDPAERAALAVIARDEARHAALAWRTVRWAVDVGGEPVRAAVARALAEMPALPTEATGLLPTAVARDVILRGWREVVAPAAAGLLAAAVTDETGAALS